MIGYTVSRLKQEVEHSMTSRLWNKKATQGTLKELRHAGFTVNKVSMGYEAFDGDELVLKAMPGMGGYLVRYEERLFLPA
jgi:hypothetical protein